jgi:S-adenosylmethionine hydrolase
LNLGPGTPPVKTAPLLALTSDFGLDDPYVGILKAVISSLAPEVRLVDLTHGIPPQDVLAGRLALEAARPYFPPGTVHLAVVDPGVGSERRALVVDAGRDLWVAPDNGLLSFLPEAEIRQVRALENPAFFLQPVSRTFHGRDVFAPAAARLASGTPPEAFGPAVEGFRRLELPAAAVSAQGVRGEVLTFDRFGNAITSIRERDLPEGEWETLVGGRRVSWAATYACVAPGEPLWLVGSSGRVEVGVRLASARELLRIGRGDEVLLRRPSGEGS